VTDAREAYTRGRDARAVEEKRYDAQSRRIGLVRLLVAAAIIGLAAAAVWGPAPSAAAAGAVAFVALFAVFVVIHSRVTRAEDRAAAARRFHERGLARVDDRWRDLPSMGVRFRDVEHPYADDLDIFGKASLFQRIDSTETRFGEERLAQLLSRRDATGWPDDVRARQAAVRELTSRLELRERLATLGAMLGADKPNPEPLLEWAEGALPFPHGEPLVWLARLLPAAMIATYFAAPALHVGRAPVVVMAILCYAITLAIGGRVGKIAGVVLAREGGLLAYAEMFGAIERESFESALLVSIRDRCTGRGASAMHEMKALARIVGFLEARENGSFRLFIAPFLLWDINCVVALERWRLRTGARAREWFVALGELEALSSLAGYAFERANDTFPELSEQPMLVATALGHPLISPTRRVDNDVVIEHAGRVLIVTGSNMSGKSTLLRALGVNAVLALAGAPVRAAKLTIGPVRIATSMRVHDSLEEGVSHFYAELKKLKRVLDFADVKGAGTVLFLLDEILHGTNSRERIIGARAIVRELVARGAMGAVSTHDLGISDLEKELDGSARNVHFEEQVAGNEMTFDYRLRDGIVTSSNALRLMRMIGITAATIDA
jgi:hypothetical protein